MSIIKVSAESRTSAVAGAIAGVIREHRHADVQAIGAGAVNQAVKAVAIARGYLQEDGIDIICIPQFTSVEIDGKERTALRLVVLHPALRAGTPCEFAPRAMHAAPCFSPPCTFSRGN
jgi:stage V sporulation protein S